MGAVILGDVGYAGEDVALLLVLCRTLILWPILSAAIISMNIFRMVNFPFLRISRVFLGKSTENAKIYVTFVVALICAKIGPEKK